MKTQKTFNLNFLISVFIKDKEQLERFEYRPFKKRWYGNQKEGFYNNDIFVDKKHKYFTKEQLENKKYCGACLMVEDNKVYYHPYVKLTFVNDEKYVKEDFKSYDEAVQWAEEEVIEKAIDVKFDIKHISKNK